MASNSTTTSSASTPAAGSPNGTAAGTTQVDQQKQKQQKPPKTFSLKEIAKHNTDEDCWIIMNGKVYDVTEYVYDHPGGDIIAQNAGGESTALYDDIGHSEEADGLLVKFYIGDVATTQKAKV